MSSDTITAAFYYDGDSTLEVAKFPEDFADWLMDNSREQDAREYLTRWSRLEETTDPEDLTFDKAVDLAEEYAPVIDFAEEIRGDDEESKAYKEAFGFLRESESVNEPWSDDKPLTWDREAEHIKQALQDQMATPVDMDTHEFPHVKVYVKKSAKIPEIAFRTFQALGKNISKTTALRFLQDLQFLCHGSASDGEIFLLCWSYVDVVPTK